MNRSSIFFKSKTIGSRLRYVVSELFERRLGLVVNYSSADNIPEGELTIGYGVSDCDLNFLVSGILEESGELNYQCILNEEWEDSVLIDSNGVATKGDLPGLVFWLLSRYEEYLDSNLSDQHGRFPSSENSLVKSKLSSFPLVEKWVSDLSEKLEAAGVQIHLMEPGNPVSFDLDNPTAYLHKSPARQLLAGIRDFLRFDFRNFSMRLKVMSGVQKDPYENMEQIGELVAGKNIIPDLFVWIGDYGPYDKGLPFTSGYFRKLIESLSKNFSIGLHPSYSSYLKTDRIKVEKERLEKITGFQIKMNRFHFLRFRLPESYRSLLSLGFDEDHSMGFSDHLGYRAGTCFPFYWYDLSREETTSLMVYPFSMMDSTAQFQLKISPDKFIQELKQQSRDGMFPGASHAIFHNEHPSWKGWEKMVSRFIDQFENVPKRNKNNPNQPALEKP